MQRHVANFAENEQLSDLAVGTHQSTDCRKVTFTHRPVFLRLMNPLFKHFWCRLLHCGAFLLQLLSNTERELSRRLPAVVGPEAKISLGLMAACTAAGTCSLCKASCGLKQQRCFGCKLPRYSSKTVKQTSRVLHLLSRICDQRRGDG